MAKLQRCLNFFFKTSQNMIERFTNKKKMKNKSKILHMISYMHNYLKNIVKNLKFKNKNVKKIHS